MKSHTLKTARFYGILDTGYVPIENWDAKCGALLDGGAGIIQLRAKRESHEVRLNLLERILPYFLDSGIPLVVNDDLDLAAAFPGVGLHVGQDDISPEKARNRLGPDPVIGLSTHSRVQAEEAIGLAGVLDYFAVGPVFRTGTKPDYEPVGLELIREVVAMKPPLPFFCIGGINPSNYKEVLQAGATGIVAVSAVLCAKDSCVAVRLMSDEL